MNLPSKPDTDRTDRSHDEPASAGSSGTTTAAGSQEPTGPDVDRLRLARGATLDRAALDRLEEFHASIVRLRMEREGLIGDFRALTRPARPSEAAVPAMPAAEVGVDGESPKVAVGPPPSVAASPASASTTAATHETQGAATATPRSEVEQLAPAPVENTTPPHGDALAVALTERLRAGSDEPPVFVPPEAPARTSRGVWVAGIAAAAVVVLAVWLVRSNRPPQDVPAAARAVAAESGERPGGPTSSTPPRQVTTANETNTAPDARGTTGEVNRTPAGLRVEIVTLRPVWIRAIADGKRAVEALTPADRTIVLDARALVVLRLGDAGAVRVRINGVDEGVAGRDGQVVDRRLVAPDNAAGASGAPRLP